MSAYDEHMATAERYIGIADNVKAGKTLPDIIAAAQVHATLAQAAAMRDLADALSTTTVVPL